jgi:glycine hydroxymethyltransferase
MPVDSKDIFAIVEKQNQWRGRECINLIASENTPSPAVRSIQLNDFMGRYAEGHPNTPIETMAAREMKELFHCAQAEVRPYSGNNANTAIAMGYLRGGDAVIANSTDAGGHISHNFFGIMGRRIQTRGQVLKPGKDNSVHLSFFPLTEDRYHIDVKKSIELIEKTKPNLLVMGKSLYLFPDPVKELAPLCRELEIPILYDGARPDRRRPVP